MKQIGKALIWMVEIAALLAIVLGVNTLLRWQKTQLQEPYSTETIALAYPPPETQTSPPTGQPLPTQTPEPSPTPLPLVDWDTLPACVNQPLTLADWRNETAKLGSNAQVARKIESYLRQAQYISSSMREIKLEDLPDILAIPDSAPVIQIARRELAVLWLNVMSGRLNLSTELTLPSLKTTNNIDKFASELETAIATGQIHTTLLDVSHQILAGKGITKSVCARIFYLQAGNKIQDVRWTSVGIENEIVLEEPSNQEFQ